MPDHPLVTRADLSTLLSSVADRTINPLAGIFGPDSISWRINRESALFLGAGRAALLQLAHPWVATSLAQHSNLLTNPIGRFHGTFRVIFTMIFGTRGQALAASRHLHTLHIGIRGELPEAVAAHPAGSHYEANETAALLWVFATLVDSALVAYQLVLPALSSAERERYYAESMTMAALFGIPPSALPPDWAAFVRYNREMWDSGVLGINDLSRTMAHRLLAGSGSWVRPPRWYRALTAASLPPRLRADFQLAFGPSEERSLRRAQLWLPRLYRRIPGRLRFVGPFQEAQARLAGRPIGPLTRANNRFWMGQPRLLFPQAAD